MSNSRKWLSEYLSFTRKERVGIITIIVCIIIISCFPLLFPYLIPGKKYDSSQFVKEIAALQEDKQDSVRKYITGQAVSGDEGEYQSPGEKYYATYTGSELFY